jgi:single-strand DNA-binding protein
MSTVNRVIIVGRLGADPELRHTAEGVPVASFNVATTETRKDRNGEKQEKTEWHRVVAWRRLGEIASDYLKKGGLVYIEGRIQSREYEGKDGVKRRFVEIVATDMKMLGSRATGEREERPATQKGYHADEAFPPEEEDDTPL